MVRFVVDLVDRLGAEHDLDRAELVNARTGQPFGPSIERLRRAMLRVEPAAQSDCCLNENSGMSVSAR